MALSCLFALPPAWSETPSPGKSLLVSGAPAEIGITPTSPEVQVERNNEGGMDGLSVTIQPGKETYPGIHYKPADGSWDLSSFGHVQAQAVNLGKKPVTLNLRIDGQTASGEWASNTEIVTIPPGEAAPVKVYFGHTFGGKPGPKLKTDAITKIVIFAGKSAEEQKFRINAIDAGGEAGEKPPVKPENVRVKPEHGVIFGQNVALEPEQIEAKEGARAGLQDGSIRLDFPAGKQPKWVSLKPKIGRWDLRDAFGVAVKFKNTGENPIQLRVKLNSNSGPTDIATSSVAVAPNAEAEIELPFAPAIPWQGIKDSTKTSWEGEKGTGTKFVSDAVSGLTLSVEGADFNQSVEVTSITAGRLSQRPIPDWMGKKPPVEGDWEMTFEENFDGDSINEKVWNIYTENYWDKKSHFSKNNVIVEDGKAKLRFEKKTGPHNDKPDGKVTDYATGFLDTYGKWVQRYGYFETRMKLTKAAGLWPAFWLMPDRGAAVGPQWKRADTGNGAMEFDIFEHLGRWGPYRTNIALHWDGYGKGHHQTGTTTIYFQPDAEGYITSGLLWLPGLAVFYINGQEVARWETPRISNVQSDIMFTNVSGGWDNNAIDDSALPDDLVIDYVRAWQRKDLASEVDGFQPKPTPTPASTETTKPPGADAGEDKKP